MASTAPDADADPRAFDAWRGFTDDELAIALKVLRACAGDGAVAAAQETRKDDDDDDAQKVHRRGGASPPPSPAAASTDAAARASDVYGHPRHKRLRVAVLPIVARVHGAMYAGRAPEALKQRRDTKRDRNRRNMAEKAADRAALDLTRLRKERLERLAALEGANHAGGAKALPLIPDGVAGADDFDAIGGAEDDENGAELNQLRACYVCKVRYRIAHHFYASLCPECAALNWQKRSQTADMRGAYALVTGARVKIGYRIALKLLRAGAYVIATTRFPIDSLRRFEREPDASKWMSRLQILAMDLRDLPGVERLCAHLLETLPRLDVVINNACQTVRRPPAYYRHLLQAEAEAGFTPSLVGANARCEFLPTSSALADETSSTSAAALRVADDWKRADDFKRAGWMAPSAALSQLELLESDKSDPASEAMHFPPGAVDVNGQQVDLRRRNSWMLKLGEVETPELLEVLAVNAAAPFVLNGKLRPLLAATVARDREQKAKKYPAAFVVNVSAMEGKFYRYKTPRHPHTNMAKAALNMMTATCAEDYAEQGIYMTAVDTGWINLEQPLETAARITEAHGFQTPIDEEDAAARVLAPVFDSVGDPPATWPCPYGKFYKDYRESEW